MPGLLASDRAARRVGTKKFRPDPTTKLTNLIPRIGLPDLPRSGSPERTTQ